MKRFLFAFVFIFAVLVALYSVLNQYGCGHKANLHPPEPRRLAIVENVSAEVDCDKIIISWDPVFYDNRLQPLDGQIDYLVIRKRGEKLSIPTTTPTATPEISSTAVATHISLITATPTITVTDESTISISPSPTQPQIVPPDYEYKLAAIAPGKPVSSIKIEIERMKFVDDGVPSVSFTAAEKFKYPKPFPPEKTEDDVDLLPGHSYFYRIQAVDSDGTTSIMSNVTEIKFFIAPGAVTDLTGKFDEKGVELNWNPPGTDCIGSELESIGGYFVERAGNELPDEFGTIATLGLQESESYIDTSTNKDTSYIYRIRAFTPLGKIPGLPSDTFTVDTTDVFPPEQPTTLNAAYSPQGVHLMWEHSTSGDVTGYRIYRKDSSLEEFILISTDDLVIDNTYIDESVDSGELYIYSVTAVDSSKMKNESRLSETRKIIIP